MSLEQSDFNVTEGTDTVLPVNGVITNGSLERDVLVTLFTNNGTATSGMHACVHMDSVVVYECEPVGSQVFIIAVLIFFSPICCRK